MASKNILLGSGVPVETDTEEHIPVVNLRTPAWRFHKDFPNRFCKTDAELDKLDAEGWLDEPGKARRLPGHEKIYDEYHATKVVILNPEVIIRIEKEKTEDQIRADILKAESDKIEEKRLENERKVEEKRLKDERKEEEKHLKEEQKLDAKDLEPEQKSEETILKEYEAAKIPPGPRLCTLCGMTFDSKDYGNPLMALNKHLKRMHRFKKKG